MAAYPVVNLATSPLVGWIMNRWVGIPFVWSWRLSAVALVLGWRCLEQAKSVEIFMSEREQQSSNAYNHGCRIVCRIVTLLMS